MVIPDFVYGTLKDVKKNCRKIINKLKKDISWNEAVELNLINTNQNDGLIFITSQDIKLNSKKNFHVYLLLRLISESDF